MGANLEEGDEKGPVFSFRGPSGQRLLMFEHTGAVQDRLTAPRAGGTFQFPREKAKSVARICARFVPDDC